MRPSPRRSFMTLLPGQSFPRTLRRRSRSYLPIRSPPGRISSGYRATGAGTRRATIFSGSAASGENRHRTASGFPATGTRSKAGIRWVPGTWVPASDKPVATAVHAGSARQSRGRTQYASAVSQRDLDAGLLVVAAEQLCLEARLLGRRSAKLDLGARPLRLDTERLPVRAGILGCADRQPRTALRTGLLPSAGLSAAGLRVCSVDQHRRLGRDRQPLCPGQHQSVSVRRLLRTELCQRRDHAVVFLHVRHGPAGVLRSACSRTTRWSTCGRTRTGSPRSASSTSSGATISRCGRLARISSRRG